MAKRTLPLTPDQASKVDAAYAGAKKVSVVDSRIYLGENPTSPVVGDYRIAYEYVPLGVVSIIARQAGARFEPYQTAAGDQLLMVDSGPVPAEKMFADAVSENTVITWVLRLVGLVLLVIGFALLMAPLGVLADFIPFIGSIVRFGTGLIAFLLAILIGTSTIAVAWFYYRPLLAIGILAAGLLAAAAIIYFGRSRKKAVASVPPAGQAAATASAAPTASKWS